MIRCNNCGWYNPDTATHCEMCDESLAGFPKVDLPVPEDDDEDDISMPEPASESLPKPEPVPETIPEPVQEPKPEEPVKSSPLTATIRFADTGGHRLDRKGPAPTAPNAAKYAATVLDASSALDEPKQVSCPKCRYPVLGNVDTCPNCGASIKSALKEPGPVPKPVPAPAPEPAPKPEPEHRPAHSHSRPSTTVKEDVIEPAPQFKQTVRDFPQEKPTHQQTPPATQQRAPHPTVRDLKATIREIPADLLERVPSQSATSYRLIPVESPDSAVIELVPGEIAIIGSRRYKFVKE